LARRKGRCKRKGSERGGVKEHGVIPDRLRTLIPGKRQIWNPALNCNFCGALDSRSALQSAGR
jgi:hypothetical protein